MAQVSLAAAIQELKTRDPVLRRLITLVGPIRYRPRSSDGHFSTLARAIVFQQLAGRVAQIILARVTAAAGGKLTADALTGVSDKNLRAAGLSANKLASLRDLSAKTLNGTIDFNTISELGDDEIIERLTAVRGIGRWTSEMFLIFALRRLDVWPVDDFGVRQGYGLAWGIPPPLPKQLEPLGERYRPYRSVVARYCWEAVALFKNSSRNGQKKVVKLNVRKKSSVVKR